MLLWKSVSLRRSQTPSWTSIEHWTQQTRRCIACWKKFHLSPRQSPKPQNSTASEDKRVHVEVHESEADGKTIRGKWVMKPHKAKYVLRSFEEDVEGEGVFASTSMAASVRMLLSQATDLRKDVKTAFLNAHMKDVTWCTRTHHPSSSLKYRAARK